MLNRKFQKRFLATTTIISLHIYVCTLEEVHSNHLIDLFPIAILFWYLNIEITKIYNVQKCLISDQ
jgi:hypothetical protein